MISRRFPSLCTLVPWGQFIVSVTSRKVGHDFLQMGNLIAYLHRPPPTLLVGLISILYGPGSEKFSSSFFPQSFPFQYHVHFSPDTVHPHFIHSINAKVKLHAVKACEGVKE